jgi:hypothetical protein
MLDVSGANWAIFALRFQMVVQGKGLWKHFDGSELCPVLSTAAQTSTAPTTAPAAPAVATPTIVPPTTAPVSPPIGIQDEINAWKKNENIAHSLLAQHLPNSTLIVMSPIDSVKKMWDAIVHDYMYKSVFAQARLCQEFGGTCCPDKGDVCNFLNELCAKKAELAAVGVIISDEEYQNAIIQSLPYHLTTFASNQMTATHLAGHEVEPEPLINFIVDKWDRTCPTGKGNLQIETDDALAVTGESSGKDKGKEVSGKGKGKGKKKGPCWTCGGDHWKRDCPKKDKKGGGGNASSKPGASVNAIVEEDDCSFMVEEFLEDEFEGEFTKESTDWLDVEELAAKEVISVSEPVPMQVEVFDLGATTHISPYCESFSTFETIPPRPLCAANKESFSAIGKGEVILDLPNSVATSKLHLSEVLYSPEAGYTLISIG